MSALYFHLNGECLLIVALLQSEIMSKPELFVEPDPDLPLALLDQKEVSSILLVFSI